MRHLGLTALLLGVGWVVGCAGRAPSPELPEVSSELERIDRRSARLERIRSVMERDLAELEKLSRTFEKGGLGTGDEAFPVDLFKHVVVDCLNTPAIELEGEPSSGVFGLECRPKFADRLEQRVKDGSAVRERVVELLRRVDQFHALRVRLRNRLGKVGGVLAETRELVTEQRADLRKRRARWEEKETEYRSSRWSEVKAEFETVDDRLEALEAQATELSGAVKAWPTRVDRANRRMYFSVTDLDEESESTAKP